MCFENSKGKGKVTASASDLVAEAQGPGGDPGAVIEIFHERYFHRLTAFGLTFTRCCLRAEEAANHALASLWKKLQKRQFKAKTPSAVLAYLYAVVRNEFANHGKKRNNEKNHLEKLAIRQAAAQPSWKETQAELDEAAEGFADFPFGHDMRVALSKLPKEDRFVLRAFYAEGLQAADMAVILGVSESSVYNKIHTARLRLKQKLEQLWNDHEPQL